MKEPKVLASVHGGHSGQFCLHASDTLEAVVQAYADRGFDWVGITEHMPPVHDRFRYDDEIEAGLTAERLLDRFERYVTEARRLKERFQGTLRIFVGMETETYTGSIPFAKGLIRRFSPDYIVGSVHHVDDLNFDFSPSHYRRAEAAAGGTDRLYLRYLDQQEEMIRNLKPEVVGHFDLIRIHDPEYRKRIEQPEILEKIIRNLKLIRELDLILDYNVRALVKGGQEPYPAGPILRLALELGIRVIPGDDSHGVDSVGLHIDRACGDLIRLGFSTAFSPPPMRTG